MKKPKDTSWKKAHKWYDSLVDKEGHFFHKELIFPKIFESIKLKENDSFLDIGCGQGVLARRLPEKNLYYGVDLAGPLLEKARSYGELKSRHFIKKDACAPFNLDKTDFTYATMILSLQNMAKPEVALQNARAHLGETGTLILVLNHPCFRIPPPRCHTSP